MTHWYQEVWVGTREVADPADGHEPTEGQVLAVIHDTVSQLHALLWLAAMLVCGREQSP